MRRTVEPLPFKRCEVCRGELLLKRIETDGSGSDAEVALYHCAQCGLELSYRLAYNPYTPHSSSQSPVAANK